MEISTYAALCRGKVSGSWSSGKNDVKDASKGAECIMNMIARGSTRCRGRIHLPLAILICTLMAPCATTGGGLVTAYRDFKSAARFKSEALYLHWTWSLSAHKIFIFLQWIAFCTKPSCNMGTKCSQKWGFSCCAFIPLLQIHLVDHCISVSLKAVHQPKRLKDMHSKSTSMKIFFRLPLTLSRNPWPQTWRWLHLGWPWQGNSEGDPWPWGFLDQWVGLYLKPSLKTQSAYPESRLGSVWKHMGNKVTLTL